jgi:hypothetical protein
VAAARRLAGAVHGRCQRRRRRQGNVMKSLVLSFFSEE